jgi:hypothetical protein
VMFMEVDHTVDQEEKDVIKNLIVYLGCIVPHLQEVKLNKLIYVAHLYHYSNYGLLLTKTPFLNFSHGPHAPAIRSVINEQLESNAMRLEISRSETEPPYSNPCIIIKSCVRKDGRLSNQCWNTMKEVVEDWGDKTFKEILDYATRTIPFISTGYREPIDLTSIQPSQSLKCALTLPERVRLHKFIKTPEEAVGKAGGCNSQACSVSVNEAAEIYLALCGDLPEKIPSKEHLGFNAQAVLDAFGNACDKNEDGTENHLTDTDGAAQLAHSLINPAGFRYHNNSVALRIGMLLLKRRGYSFDRNFVEENSPAVHDYESLRDWFGRASSRLATG